MKLKPCPSCGSDQIAKWGDNRVVCVICGCSIPTHLWNTRYYPKEVTDVLKAAKMLLKELPQLNCSDLRHNKGDHHPWDKDCKPKERYDGAALRLINALKTTGV